MKRLATLLLAALIVSGCGYTLRSAQDSPYETIYIPVFFNKISINNISSDYKLYYRGLEIELENILRERFRYDGNILPVSSVQDADIVVEGEILDYNKSALSYASNEDVDEYKITVSTNVRLIEKEKELWAESMSGESTYLTAGANAKSETQALRDALGDLSRKIVDRVVINW
ncbi:MAG: LptE family protein [Candidatus Kaelpia imicola]|nr:LptE family protein [Candidatus Kaelpia imicola]